MRTSAEGATSAARCDGDRLVALPFPDLGALLASGPGWRELAADYEGESIALVDADFAPPVPRPEKIICVGLNYRGHALEAHLELPSHPVLFGKYWRSLIGANDELQLPSNSDEVDWEAELGVVIGTPTRYVDESDALDAVAGYTIVNDISMRDWQSRTGQFLQGKTFEASTPVGPFLVTPDEVDHAKRLELKCLVDDELMQQGYTDDLVFGVAEIISYISQIITLSPGDLIATGTPAGVGGARSPAVYLKSGQHLQTVVEGLGEQRNRCVAPQRSLVLGRPTMSRDQRFAGKASS
jgi:acylpyruvate hydrolase